MNNKNKIQNGNRKFESNTAIVFIKRHSTNTQCYSTYNIILIYCTLTLAAMFILSAVVFVDVQEYFSRRETYNIYINYTRLFWVSKQLLYTADILYAKLQKTARVALGVLLGALMTIIRRLGVLFIPKPSPRCKSIRIVGTESRVKCVI